MVEDLSFFDDHVENSPNVDPEFTQAREAQRAGRGPSRIKEEWERYRKVWEAAKGRKTAAAK